MTMSDAQVRALFRDGRRLLDAKVEQAVLDAGRRDRRGGTLTVDGFPGSCEAGGGRGGSELTSVESAAARRIDGQRHEHDVVAELVARMKRHLEDAVAAAEAVGALVKALAELGQEAPDLGQWCAWHAEHGHQEPGEHYGTVGGRLDVAALLCTRDYDYVRRYGGERPEYDALGNLRRRVADSRKVDVGQTLSTGRSTVGTGGAFAWQDP